MSNFFIFFFQIKYQRRFTFTLRHFTFRISETLNGTKRLQKLLEKHNPRDKIKFNESSPFYKTMYYKKTWDKIRRVFYCKESLKSLLKTMLKKLLKPSKEYNR